MTHDYSKLGFVAGLEIHQQLDTPKLFSGAPSYLRNDEPDYVIQRKLHAVAGESGEVDVAVEHEASLDRKFLYEGYNDTVSLVELDEEPPRPINEEALDVALQIALLLNCEIYPVSQVMRKTVIDGSNTSGFQRTVLIGHDGYVETSFGKIWIDSVALEEDSARKVESDEKSVKFRLDRLGIPLVEIATLPSIKNPEQVKECAMKIGEILRSCRVKRGIGTIRQDVNVSIKGHERVEIKGFQDPKMFVKTIDLEIERQLAEIEKMKSNKRENKASKEKSKSGFVNSDIRGGKNNLGLIKGEVRNALPDGTTEFLRPLPGRARMYPETDLELLRIDKKRIDKLKKSLPKLRRDIKEELKKKGLNNELINLVVSDSEALDGFMTLIKVYSKDANLVGKMITLWRQELATKYKMKLDEVLKVLHERVLEKILERVRNGKLDVSDVKVIMSNILDGKKFEEAVKVEKAGDDEIEEEIRKMVKEKPGLRANAYMGLIMAKFGGKLDAKKTMEIVKKIVGE